ncbi:MAG TPA: hypothetical protein VFU70_05085, partial [Pseudolabrys sp.]|nr:hypothetical protein [Pseudolabrys sp.]
LGLARGRGDCSIRMLNMVLLCQTKTLLLWRLPEDPTHQTEILRRLAAFAGPSRHYPLSYSAFPNCEKIVTQKLTLHWDVIGEFW